MNKLENENSKNISNYYLIMKTIKNNYIPMSVTFELTYRCNLSCKHCYVVNKNNKKGELTFSEITTILDQLVEMGTFYLTFTGGEPLLREDFMEVAKYAKKKGFLLTLFSNGTTITSNIVNELKEIGFLKVEMSLYGASSETHDAITQKKNSFDYTVNAIKLLRKKNIDVCVKTVIMSLNVKEFSAIKKMAEDLEVNFRYDCQLTPQTNGSLTPLNYQVSEEEMDAYLGLDYVRSYHKLNDEDALGHFNCNAGKTTFAISPRGDVYPCVCLPISLGNIKERNLSEIWYKSKSNILTRLRNLTLSDLKTCHHCPYRPYCSRCHGAAYLETGDITNPSSVSCRIARWRHQRKLPGKEV